MPTTYTVSSLTDSGPGSLRAAITSVNGDTTADVIDFSVAGVIKLTSGPLPAITDPQPGAALGTVKIDGTSAPGFTGEPVVEIDNNGFAGLTTSRPDCTLASLSIVNANGPGVTLHSLLGSFGPPGGDDTIVGNYIGLALDGSVAANTGVGLLVEDTGDTIGGTTSLDRNIISGNGGGGIQVGSSGGGGDGISANVLGNFIGTDPTGQAAAPNQGNGITIFSGIGGFHGLEGGMTVGGTDPGDSNTIAFNRQYGVVVDSGRGNAIRENSIFNNGTGGILLADNGNDDQPAPVLTAAFQPTPTTIEVSGIAPRGGIIDIFATPPGTPPGQGQNFVGSVNAGVAPFIFRSTFASASGSSITATATVSTGFTSGNTSAFSPALTLTGNANTVFVASAYGLLLNRAPDVSGAAYWADQLNSGTLTPASFVLALEASAEYIGDQIDAMYLRYLNRPADAPTRQFFVNFVQAGGTLEQVAAALLSTQEYYVLQGGTDQGYLTGLYDEVLNHAPSTSALAAWETVLNSGASRASVAIAFLNSQEYRTVLVQNDYMTFLYRAADPGGLTFWANALDAAFTDQQVLAEILGSPEAYHLWS